ncbi:MAG TPA: hypothetical protein VJT14_16350 [Candidatus Dormibacteraeota bacterium]|nr:hypothetical protein [Candidatus Dormibacteraeota bacterium]
MIIKMTNRLLSIVIAIALTSGIVAHAAQAPQRPLAPLTLPATLQTAASHVGETATGAIDPSGAIRAAYQRNRVALEHLRQQASPLKGSARATFDQFISDQELALTQTERAALATSRPAVSSSIAAMDKVVADAEAELNRELLKATRENSNNQDRGGNSKSHDESSKSRQSQGNTSQNGND